MVALLETTPGEDYTRSLGWKRIHQRGSTSALLTPQTLQKLTIREISLTPIVVPLDGVYRGSYYRMENRASVITRVVTEEGIVGEAYAGRRGQDARRHRRRDPRRDHAPPDRPERLRLRALLGARLPRHLRPAARPADRARRARLRRLRDLGRDRQGARPAAVAALGRLPGPHPGQHHRRLLRARPRRRSATRSPSGATWAFAGCKFKVGGARRRPSDADAHHGRARGRRRRLRDHDRRQPGLHAARRRSTSAPGSRPRHPLVRGACVGRTTAATCARCARAAASRSAPARASTSPGPAAT